MRTFSAVFAVASGLVVSVNASYGEDLTLLPATYDEVSYTQEMMDDGHSWMIPAFEGQQVYFRPRELKLYEGATLKVYDCADVTTPKRVFDYNDRFKYVVSNTGCLKVTLETNPEATTMSKVRFMYHSRSRNYRLEDMPCTLARGGEKNCENYSNKRVAAGLPPCVYYTEQRYYGRKNGLGRVGCEEEDYCQWEAYEDCDARDYCERSGGLCFNKPAPPVEQVASCEKPGRPATECDPDHCAFFEFTLPNLNTDGKTFHKVKYGCKSNEYCDFYKVPHSYSADGLVAQKAQCDMVPACHWDEGVDACLLITEMPTATPTISPTSSPTKYPTTSPTKYPTMTPTTTPTTSPEFSDGDIGLGD